MIQNHSKTVFSKFDHQLDIFNKNTSSTTHRNRLDQKTILRSERLNGARTSSARNRSSRSRMLSKSAFEMGFDEVEG